MKNKTEYSLFIFAHQDDETAVFYEIECCIRANLEIYIAYLTSGRKDGKIDHTRNYESLRVLSKLGVKSENILFIGNQVEIPDGNLVEYIDDCIDALDSIINKISKPAFLYTHAWEGGHQDHDAAHIVGLRIAEKFSLLGKAFQFPFYTRHNMPSQLFKLFYAMKENGNIIVKKIPLINRIRYVSYSLMYPSQWKSWVGLFPFYFYHHAINKGQILQPMNSLRIKQKPHEGDLLYERRKIFQWKNFSKRIEKFT